MSVATTTTTTTTPSEELLLSQKKDARIQMLERQKQRQAEELTLLRSEIGASQIKHKEDIYWMRLECDSLRRDKEAAEDRMAELLRDLKDLANEQQQDDDLPEVLDAPYVLHLQSQLDKSMQTVGILDNQISMVKKSCDEVVKSLKEEIGDVMDDKCRMEMELMNQLASLDNEKRQVELQYEEEIKEKSNVIAELKQLGLSLQQQQTTTATTNNPNGGTGTGTGTGSNMNSELLLQEQVQELQQVNTKLSEQLQNVRNESRDEVIRLEDVNSDLRQELSSLQKDFESTKREASSSDAVQALTRDDRQETMETLERVAIIWEKADDSIQQLEHTMDALKPNDDQEETSPDGERLLSTLETASLVHGQVKVALLLIELKLRNQLGSIKNDKKYRPSTSTHKKGAGDTKLMEKISEIQKEAVQAMSQVEHSLSNQIQQLQQISSVEDEDLIQTKTMQVASYKQQVQTLQDELSRLQQQHHVSSSSTKHNPKTLGVSRAVMERLQNEVLTVAQRVKDKNETIEKLTHQVKEHKVREAALKKEMKRLLKRRAER